MFFFPFSLFSSVLPCPTSIVHNWGPFLYYPQWWVFTILALNRFCPGIGILPRPPTSLSTAQPSPFICAGRVTSHSQTKEFYFVFLLTLAFPSGYGWAFSLTIPYGMHLVIPTHLSLLRVVCHLTRTFPPKKLEREPKNRLSPSPHRQTIPSLTFDLWPTTHVSVGYKWVVLEPRACSTSMCVNVLFAIHAFAMTWGIVCTFRYSFLTSCGMDESLGFILYVLLLS